MVARYGLSRALVLAATALTILATFLSVDSPAVEASGLVVVTANLQEAFGEDAKDNSEMDLFARRLLNQVPATPDVLLLQEVRRSSARFVANLLSSKTGEAYAVVSGPGDRHHIRTETKDIFFDTAVVINTETMRRIGEPGYLENGTSTVRQRNAYAYLEQRATSRKMSAISVHLLKNHDDQKARWVNRNQDFLDAKYPGADARIAAGDFNAPRCSSGLGTYCDTHPFWDAMTETQGLTDAVWSTIGYGGVDYIFTDAGVVQAGADITYDQQAARQGLVPYYSDHEFRWALTSAN